MLPQTELLKLWMLDKLNVYVGWSISNYMSPELGTGVFEKFKFNVMLPVIVYGINIPYILGPVLAT